MDVETQTEIRAIWLALQMLLQAMAGRPETKDVAAITKRLCLRIVNELSQDDLVADGQPMPRSDKTLALLRAKVAQLFDPGIGAGGDQPSELGSTQRG